MLHDKIFLQERRIYYHIHRLRIPYAFHEEFYAEGMVALWQAYESYDESLGELDTHLNSALNFHFIDLIRKNKRSSDAQLNVKAELIQNFETGNKLTRTNQLLLNHPIVQVRDNSLWINVKQLLSKRQWTWLYNYVVKEYSLKEIAENEDVSLEAVKSWAKEARKKLRANDKLKTEIIKHIERTD